MFRPTDVPVPGSQAVLEPEAERAALRRMMLVVADGHRFALPLDSVREILEPRPYTRLPGGSAAVSGMINVRGRIVTVLDLGAFLGLAPCAAAPEHSVVLVEHDARQVGLAVADILHILDVDPLGLDDSVETLRALGFDRDCVSGVGEAEERLYVALRPDAVLRPVFAARRP
jgi:purine-binding chemotaxis protein CheW